MGDRRVERDDNHLLSLFRFRGGEVHGAVLRTAVKQVHKDPLDGDAPVVKVRQGRLLKGEGTAMCTSSYPYCYSDGYCVTSACSVWSSSCDYHDVGCA